MDRINGADTVDIGGGRRGFRDEDLPTGQIGTEVTAAWLNMMQEELLKVITEAGLTPSANDWSQLWAALQKLGLGRSASGRAWLSITSSTATTPPAAPVKGDIYLVPVGATGVWAGHAGKLAEWTGTEWTFATTPDGHGISLPDGRVFEKIGGVYTEFLASRSWVMSRTAATTKLGRLPWLPVISMTTTAPPASPAQGDAYLVPTGATGAWAANVGRIAEWVDGAWSYATPVDGHGISLPDGRVFERIGGVYTEFLASRSWVGSRTAATTKLGRLPWLPVISMTTTAPPASPAQGDAYLVPTGATGAWAANVGRIAEWVDGAWSYATPVDGHGISLPDGRAFERISGVYTEKLALDVQSGKWSYAQAGGAANVLTATLPIQPVSYASIIGTAIRIKISATNTSSSVSLNLNGLGAMPIVFNDGTALRPGDLPLGIIELLVEQGRFTISGFSPAFVGSALASEGGRILNYRVWRETTREIFTGVLNPGLLLFSAVYAKRKANSRLVFEAFPSLRLASAASTSYARATLNGNADTDQLQNHYLFSNNNGINFQPPQSNKFIWDNVAAGTIAIEYRVGQIQTATTTIVKNPSTLDGNGWVDGFVSTWVVYEVEEIGS
jgi:hypothetical protein